MNYSKCKINAKNNAESNANNNGLLVIKIQYYSQR